MCATSQVQSGLLQTLVFGLVVGCPQLHDTFMAWSPAVTLCTHYAAIEAIVLVSVASAPPTLVIARRSEAIVLC